MFAFLHSYIPSPVILSVGYITLRWYGVFIGIATLVGLVVAIKAGKRYGIPKNTIMDISFWLVVWGVIGARIYHVLNEPTFYLSHPGAILKIWHGGLAIHGALLAGILVLTNFAKRLTHVKQSAFQNALTLLDVFTPALLLGQAIGRIGNYFNQELFGLPSSLPWSIPIAAEHRPKGFENFSHFHPTFLYESLWDIAGFIVLLVMQSANTKNKNRFKQRGCIFASYLVLYSIGRMLTEFLRIDTTPHIFGMRLPLVVSISLCALGILLLFILWGKQKSATIRTESKNVL
jgi:phosphatidylglycerol:prolipoprotein diacylglycerol transferase